MQKSLPQFIIVNTIMTANDESYEDLLFDNSKRAGKTKMDKPSPSDKISSPLALLRKQAYSPSPSTKRMSPKKLKSSHKKNSQRHRVHHNNLLLGSIMNRYYYGHDLPKKVKQKV
jgi:hypothetical protein